MKRKFMKQSILMALSLLFAIFLKAQTIETKNGFLNSKFGVKLGLNVSNLYVKDVSSENTKLGFQVGFLAKTPVSTGFSIQTELIYSLKGAQLEYDNLFAKGKASFNLHYIELPILAVFNIGKNFNLHIGPYVSYLAGVNVKNKTENGSYDFNKEINKNNFESFDYGLAGGVGLDADNFGFGVRYNYGLNAIGKEKQVFGQTYRFPNAKNAVLQAYITFAF